MVTSILGIVICRVGAVLLLVEGAKSLQYVLPALLDFPGDTTAPLVWFVLTTMIPAGTGIALWFLAGKISSVRLASAHVEIESSLDSLDLVRIGTVLIGLYAVYEGILSGLTTEATIWAQQEQFRNQHGIRASAAWNHVSMRVSYVAQLLLGAAILAGRKRIAGWLDSARDLGTGRAG